jgi:hypothetical protein
MSSNTIFGKSLFLGKYYTENINRIFILFTFKIFLISYNLPGPEYTFKNIQMITICKSHVMAIYATKTYSQTWL